MNKVLTILFLIVAISCTADVGNKVETYQSEAAITSDQATVEVMLISHGASVEDITTTPVVLHTRKHNTVTPNRPITSGHNTDAPGPWP